MSLIEGQKTSIECTYNFVDLNDPSANTDEYFENNIYPEFDHVLMISGTWSFNPNEINKYNYLEKGLGYLAKLKENNR